MCRFLAYKGAPISLHQLIFAPQNSLIHQSYHALERDDPVNGDGFGIGWYVPEIHPQPARFTSIRPAWNNQNLQSLAPKISSGAVFAHVRDANMGSVIAPNCHPFQFGRLLMMHNGVIGDFPSIKRHLRNRLSDETYAWIEGQTDTEHFFALVLDHLLEEKREGHDHDDFIRAIEKAIVDLREILDACRVHEHFYLNLAMTDGRCVVACRYDSNPYIESPTLYYSEGGRYECIDGLCQMVRTDGSDHAVLVVSEKLTGVAEDWHVIPEEHFVVVTEDLEVSIRPVEI